MSFKERGGTKRNRQRGDVKYIARNKSVGGGAATGKRGKGEIR